ncbi:hypothetical protein ANT_30580 [Anaerolinea thermophila UNI-1]|uniref:Uncharacterized protein n=1 Tax=Anaerolinea thermophila (strain DSM 14523 / JCM 11388 / NBRC 100420 / UNI-1) TaxID=926569 RepID=E8N2T4_ANATU|nr:hypothetical protein ANT_30580 [Anaerolinea thermophila UNI-1]
MLTTGVERGIVICESPEKVAFLIDEPSQDMLSSIIPAIIFAFILDLNKRRTYS